VTPMMPAMPPLIILGNKANWPRCTLTAAGADDEDGVDKAEFEGEDDMVGAGERTQVVLVAVTVEVVAASLDFIARSRC